MSLFEIANETIDPQPKTLFSELTESIRNARTAFHNDVSQMGRTIGDPFVLDKNGMPKAWMSYNRLDREYVKQVLETYLDKDIRATLTKRIEECFKEMSAVLKKHTNMEVKFSYGEYVAEAERLLDAHVQVSQLSLMKLLDYHFAHQKNHTKEKGQYLTESQRVEIKEALNIIKEDEKNFGQIDLKTGKVSGVFAKNVSEITMGTWWFLSENANNAEELAYKVLHEVGHIFTSYEYISESRTFNHVLRGLVDVTVSDVSMKDKVTYIRELTEKAKFAEPIDAVKVASMKSPNAVAMLIAAEHTVGDYSEIGTREYDSTTIEALADQYAMRYQVGKYAASSMMKLMHIFGSKDLYKSRRTVIAGDVLRIMTDGLLAGTISMTVAGGAAAGLASTILIPSIISVGAVLLDAIFIGNSRAHGLPIGNRHDDDLTRFSRMKEDIIAQLKGLDMSSPAVNELLDTISAFDHYIQGQRVKNSLTDHVLHIFGTFTRKANYRKDQQEVMIRDLESLVNNDLFVKSAELEQIAQARREA